MKILARVLLGTTIAAAGLTVTALAQTTDRSRLYTTPLPPPREALDRLNMQMAWRLYVPMDGRRDGLASVQLHGQDLYVQTRSGLVTLIDADTGVTRWRTHVGIPYRAAHDLAFNSREVYVVNNTYLYALDRRSGAERWHYRLREGVAAPPVADENLIYIAAPTGRFTAYYLPRTDIAAALPGGITAAYDEAKANRVGELESVEKRRQRIVSVKGETRSSTGTVSYLTPTVREASSEEETGPQPVRVWEDVTSLRLEYPVLYTREYLVLPTPNGVVLTLGKLPREGGGAAEIYRFSTDSTITAPGGHYEEMAYIGAEDANLYALRISNGNLQWRYTAGTAITRKPAVTDQDIYVVAARNGMTRLNRATGEPMWRIPLRGRIVENNAAADRFLAVNPKYVYTSDASGRLLILDRRRGVQLSNYDVKDFVFPVSNEVTDRLYLAANNGLIVCLHDREYQTPYRHRKGEEESENPTKLILAKPITDPGSKPMSLRDLLEDWTKRYSLKFRIAERAFQGVGVESPAEKNVNVPRTDNKPLGDVLKAVLAQVKCVYQVVGDVVVILPAAAPPPPAP